MNTIDTKYFGPMPLDSEACFDFPGGLPAFENEHSFLLLQLPDHQPLVFLQSAATPSLCFIALPILAVDPDYQLALSPEDFEELGFEPSRQPCIGVDVVALTLLSVRENAPTTANLLAPLVVNLANRRALQAIRHDRRYSHEHPLSLKKVESAC